MRRHNPPRRSPPQRKTVWPSRSELDLLRAALIPDERAVQAWDRWNASLRPGEPAPRRLLPLVAWNLRRVAPRARGLEDAERELETTWARNQDLRARLAPVLADLEGAGVPVVVLKGAALAHASYPLAALRPVGDVDLLVGPRELPRVVGFLRAVGWRPTLELPESAARRLHSAGYRRADGLEVDVHAYALLECCYPGADEAFLARAVPFSLGGLAARTLAPCDQLLHVCAHGLRWSEPAAIHWAADAAMILRAAPDLDWDALVVEAVSRDLARPLASALALLRDELEAPVPPAPLGALAKHATGWRRGLETAARVRRPALGRGLFLHWCNHARTERGRSLAARWARFPGYLREMWDVESPWLLPWVATRRATRRLARSPSP